MMTKTFCGKRTVQGSRGMHAEDSYEYGCALEAGHDPSVPCDYSRRLGKPTTSVGASGDPPMRWSVKSRMARVEALSERVSEREVSTPMRAHVRLMDQVKAARDVLVSFGPVTEVDSLLDRTEAEVARWE